MSLYTTELRYICENLAGFDESQERDSVAEVIEKARPKLFAFDYPIFEASYAKTLETKIIRHFYTREIAHETVGLFRLALERKMNEIMPYYNSLYLSAQNEFDPSGDVDYTEEYHGTTTNLSNGSSNSTSSANASNTNTSTNTKKDAYSDTPQGTLSDVENNTYLTDFRKVQDSNSSTMSGTSSASSNGTSSNNANGTNDYTKRVFGHMKKSGSENILDYRKTLLNIDIMVIEELESLFFGLWV